MVTFIWPWLLTLLVLPFFLPRFRSNSQKTLGPELPPDLIKAMDQAQSAHTTHNPFEKWLLWLLWWSLVIAASQPQLELGYSITPASGRSLVLAVDLSGSMERQDFDLNGASSNRLDIVKAVATDFIERQKGNRIGLVLFGDEAFIASPLSFDLSAVKHSLAEAGIGMAGRTTALGDGLGLSMLALRNDAAQDKAIVLLSDGTNNAGGTNPLSAAKIAAEWEIQVHTIGLGSVDAPTNNRSQNPSAELDTETLKSIAEITGGEYFRATNTKALEHIYKTIEQMEVSTADAPPVIPTHDIRHYFLIIALLCTLLLYSSRYRAQGESA